MRALLRTAFTITDDSCAEGTTVPGPPTLAVTTPTRCAGTGGATEVDPDTANAVPTVTAPAATTVAAVTAGRTARRWPPGRVDRRGEAGLRWRAMGCTYPVCADEPTKSSELPVRLPTDHIPPTARI
ncbi:hypothetical protein FRAHR75_550014 [Frankia sp. Hr75.2]|nr:hypothetical protein FRAHR75_550014 [Frankia sp. Hr75.2]SQD93744.1 hypothetical protein FMEAI12_1850004 [Parafrankia sp. Ea1.12]